MPLLPLDAYLQTVDIPYVSHTLNIQLTAVELDLSEQVRKIHTVCTSLLGCPKGISRVDLIGRSSMIKVAQHERTISVGRP